METILLSVTSLCSSFFLQHVTHLEKYENLAYFLLKVKQSRGTKNAISTAGGKAQREAPRCNDSLCSCRWPKRARDAAAILACKNLAYGLELEFCRSINSLRISQQWNKGPAKLQRVLLLFWLFCEDALKLRVLPSQVQIVVIHGSRSWQLCAFFA